MSKPSESDVLFDAPGPRTRRAMLIGNVVATLAVLAIVAWGVSILVERGQFTADKWRPFVQGDIWQYYLVPGLISTLKAALVAIVTSNVVGILLGLGRLSHSAVVRWVCTTIVEFFRAVPVLVMMLFGYYALATSGLVPSDQAPYLGVILGLTLYNGAVIAELVRSGVTSLPAGQREAALALGLSRGRSLRIIELPQALIAMMPSMVSQLVVILKDTALGYLITYPELLLQARQAGTAYSNLLPSLMVAAVVFIVVNYSLTWLAQLLARRLSSSTALGTADDEGTDPGDMAQNVGSLAAVPGGADGQTGERLLRQRSRRRPGDH